MFRLVRPVLRERYCFLDHTVRCRRCDAPFDDTQGELRFTWGAPEERYRIGDHIRWIARDPKLSERLLDRRDYGTPDIIELYAFDCDDDYSLWRCSACGVEYDGPALWIEEQRIVHVRLFEPGEVEATFGVDRGIDDIVYRDLRTGAWTVLGE
jgi:hypothetical protein